VSHGFDGELGEDPASLPTGAVMNFCCDLMLRSNWLLSVPLLPGDPAGLLLASSPRASTALLVESSKEPRVRDFREPLCWRNAGSGGATVSFCAKPLLLSTLQQASHCIVDAAWMA
jgi:hypothetical protein